MEHENKEPLEGGTQENKWLRYPRKAMSGIVYSAAIVLMLVFSLLFSFTLSAVISATGTELEILQEQDWYKYLSYGLYQIAYIAVVLLFACLYKQKPREFGYRKTHPKYFLVAALLAFGLLFSLNWVNGLFIRLLELVGYNLPSAKYPELTEREYTLIYQLPSLEGGGIVGVLFVVALLPAILEETIFRGIILDGIKDIGTVAACLLGGLLFSIFHQNPAQTVYQFICGAVFTLVTIRADSVLPAVFMHFANNAVIIFDAKYGFLTNMSGGAYIAVCVVSAAALLGTLAYLIFFDKKTDRKKEGAIKPFILSALVGIVASGVMWISALVTGIAG